MNYAEKIETLIRKLAAAKLYREKSSKSGTTNWTMIETKGDALALVAEFFGKGEFTIHTFKNGWQMIVIENVAV